MQDQAMKTHFSALLKIKEMNEFLEKKADYENELENNSRVYDKFGNQIHGITSKVIDLPIDIRRVYQNCFTNIVPCLKRDNESDLAILASKYKELAVDDDNFNIPNFFRKLEIGRNMSTRYCPMHLYNAYFNQKDWLKSIKEPILKAKCIPQAKEKQTNLMDLSEAKKAFYYDYLQPLFSSENKKFVVDQYNSKILDQIIRYFVRVDCDLDLTKGIMLYGKTGSGKSSLMYALSRFTKDFDLDSKFNFCLMEDLQNKASETGASFLNEFKAKDICLDEFGAQRYLYTHHYKQKIHVFSTIVERRWSRYRKIQNQLTHGTTNINFTPAIEVMLNSECGSYKGMNRELSRIKGMFNFVSLSGIDRRL